MGHVCLFLFLFLFVCLFVFFCFVNGFITYMQWHVFQVEVYHKVMYWNILKLNDHEVVQQMIANALRTRKQQEQHKVTNVWVVDYLYIVYPFSRKNNKI